MKYLQIVDSEVVATFSGPQDPEVFPDLVEVEDDDPRYLAAVAPLQPEPSYQRDSLLAQAAIRIAPLEDAVDLGDATDADIALLTLWKRYRVSLNRLNLAVSPIAWPEQPE